MTLPAPRPDRGGSPRPTLGRRATRLVSGLLLLAIGLGGGVTAGLVMPRAVGADPSPPPDVTRTLPEGYEVYQEALDIIRDFYVDPSAATDEALLEGSIRGMVDALGDTGHTVYLTREEVTAESDALDGTVIGIGVTVDERADGPLIISVLDGSPADQAGLRAGDRIVAVDGVRTDRASTEDLVRRVRGEAGSPVELRIRSRDGTTRDVSIVRERIEVPPVSWAFVPGTRIAVIRLVQFSSGAGREVADAARDALAGEASAIVLDLRGNPGGLLNEAIAVASTFLEDGVVYRSLDRAGDEERVRVRGDAVVPDLPMAVLVDYGSASSSEIVAAALQDAGRATIVGETTYGTGTVLNIFPLSDGSAIRLGVQQWRTPDGESVFQDGLVPDVEIGLPEDGVALDPSEIGDLTRLGLRESGDTQLRRAVRLLQARRA